MAIISVQFDTVAKTMSVTMDGNEVGNVEYLSFNNYDGRPCMNLSTKPETIQGMTVYQSIYANENGVEIEEKKGNALSKSLASLMKKSQL